MIEFSERISAIRKARDLRQVDIAEQIGVNVRTYQAYEANKKEPTLPIAVRIAKSLNVSLDYLTGLSDNEEY